MSNQIGFIGCGNMGSAIARAISKVMDPSQVMLANRTPAKAEALASELGCRTGSNEEIARQCRYIFLGVKPQMMEEMLQPLQQIFSDRSRETSDSSAGSSEQKDFVLVTMAAGLSIETIQRMAGGRYPVIRIMPNTPVSIGKGMTLVCTSPEVDQTCLEEFFRIMSATGRLDMLSEKLIDAASALSGCGPAYVYLFIEALADGAVECGLPRQKAIDYACQTLIGSAALVQESGSHPGVLKDAVCSPGGTTIAGVHALERGGFRCAAMDAVKAAYDKTIR
ncbi:MAG: pyrroline-5-carboxylate reductase [Lachnospiraceae bacterium]|nr:pyrroline-5-carboxylate reductase [Lachnospiraceae bacterium]